MVLRGIGEESVAVSASGGSAAWGGNNLVGHVWLVVDDGFILFLFFLLVFLWSGHTILQVVRECC